MDRLAQISRSDGCSMVRVRASSVGHNTETNVYIETAERIRGQYGQRGHSMDVLFKYGAVWTYFMRSIRET